MRARGCVDGVAVCVDSVVNVYACVRCVSVYVRTPGCVWLCVWTMLSMCVCVCVDGVSVYVGCVAVCVCDDVVNVYVCGRCVCVCVRAGVYG